MNITELAPTLEALHDSANMLNPRVSEVYHINGIDPVRVTIDIHSPASERVILETWTLTGVYWFHSTEAAARRVSMILSLVSDLKGLAENAHDEDPEAKRVAYETPAGRVTVTYGEGYAQWYMNGITKRAGGLMAAAADIADRNAFAWKA